VAISSVHSRTGRGRGCVKAKTDLAVNNFLQKCKLRNLADLNHDWDFWRVSLNLQKCRVLLHGLGRSATDCSAPNRSFIVEKPNRYLGQKYHAHRALFGDRSPMLGREHCAYVLKRERSGWIGSQSIKSRRDLFMEP
jgi:hypothetical protein